MPVTVERLPEQPIIVVVYTGRVTVGDVQSVFARSSNMLKPDDELMYRITCIEEIDVDFAEILHFAQSSTLETPGSSTDPRFRVVIVGHDKWTKLFVQFMSKKQFGGISIPCFHTREQAMEYVQRERNRLAAGE
jgi:hypothetical protein